MMRRPAQSTKNIGKQGDLFVFASAQQKRSEKSSQHGEHGNALGISAQRDGSNCRGDQYHSNEADFAVEDGVVTASGPQRQQQDGLAQGDDAFREVGITSAEEPMAPRQHQCAEKNPNGNATRRPNPIIVEGILKKKRNTDEDG
jgi:hypothetical protein